MDMYEASSRVIPEVEEVVGEMYRVSNQHVRSPANVRSEAVQKVVDDSAFTEEQIDDYIFYSKLRETD